MKSEQYKFLAIIYVKLYSLPFTEFKNHTNDCIYSVLYNHWAASCTWHTLNSGCEINKEVVVDFNWQWWAFLRQGCSWFYDFSKIHLTLIISYAKLLDKIVPCNVHKSLTQLVSDVFLHLCKTHLHNVKVVLGRSLL